MTAMPAWVDAAIKPLDSDPKDMSWLLVNAKLSWKRSGPGETVTWVRQAADLARQQGDHARASGLAAAAKEIEKRVPTANSGLPRRALAETGRYVVTPDAPTQMGDLDDGLVAQTVPPEPKSQPPDLEKARHKPVRPDIPITARDGEEGTLVMTPAPPAPSDDSALNAAAQRAAQAAAQQAAQAAAKQAQTAQQTATQPAVDRAAAGGGPSAAQPSAPQAPPPLPAGKFENESTRKRPPKRRSSEMMRTRLSASAVPPPSAKDLSEPPAEDVEDAFDMPPSRPFAETVPDVEDGHPASETARDDPRTATHQPLDQSTGAASIAVSGTAATLQEVDAVAPPAPRDAGRKSSRASQRSESGRVGPSTVESPQLPLVPLQAVRVSVKVAGADFEVKRLNDGEEAPPGTQEAVLLAVKYPAE